MVRKKIITVIMALVAFGFTAQAQPAIKFAHINYMEVVDSIPSMMSADAFLKSEYEKGEKTIEDLTKAYQAAEDAYLAEKPTLPLVVQELREKQLGEQFQLLQYKQQTLEQDLQILNDRLYGPIQENLEKAIEIVAQRHKVTYMMEETQMLYTDPNGGLDLTNEVRIELVRLENERAATGGGQ